MKGGLWTVLVQFIFSAKINIPTVIISSTIGVIAVSEYSIAQKLVGVGMMVINVALQPLWTVYGEAYYSGDRKWVEKTLYLSIKIVFIITILLSIFNYFFGQNLIALWLGGEIIPSSLLILMFSLWMIATSINVCFAMLLNGTGNFKNQALISIVLVSIALAISYISCGKYESVGVVFAMFFISELLRIPFFFMEAKKVISKI
jgi:O-antigen/teichoic acid export membrane protein